VPHVSSIASPDFQRAMVALSYFMGRRDSQLVEAFSEPLQEALLCVRRLGHSERERRAEVLARELSRVALAVDARSIK
jgi:hypothetical protein